ncbi:hypothetical protein Q7P35_005514 [Cladosporium inversicolor]
MELNTTSNAVGYCMVCKGTLLFTNANMHEGLGTVENLSHSTVKFLPFYCGLCTRKSVVTHNFTRGEDRLQEDGHGEGEDRGEGHVQGLEQALRRVAARGRAYGEDQDYERVVGHGQGSVPDHRQHRVRHLQHERDCGPVRALEHDLDEGLEHDLHPLQNGERVYARNLLGLPGKESDQAHKS